MSLAFSDAIPPSRPVRLHGLDALRSFAAVLVVLLHAGIPYMRLSSWRRGISITSVSNSRRGTTGNAASAIAESTLSGFETRRPKRFA